MHTMTLWTAGVFSTTISRSGPTSSPSSSAAAEPSASARALNAGSTQARATSRAPRSGFRLAIASTWRSTSAAVTTPFRISSSSTAACMRR